MERPALSPDAASPRPVHRLARVPTAYWVAAAVVGYAVVSFTFAWLRVLNFGLDTWDAGIYMQALWSTGHGHPFWEAADYETGGFSSLLQVHSVFLFYLLVPLYSEFPSPLTLLAVQSIVVAIAAVPLYLLARDLTGSDRWGLFAAIAYLAWMPTLASNLYDFHSEAFLPVEVFTVVLLWHRGRYGVGFLVAVLAFLTFELAPILLVFVGVMFLIPGLPSLRRWGSALRASLPLRSRLGTLVRDVRRGLATRRALASIALILASAAAYGLLLVVREQYLSGWLGIGPFPSNPVGYVVGANPAGLQLSWTYLEFSFGAKVEAWLVFLALLGFVPLLAPRALVISIPWLVFSFFSGNANYVDFGFQYGFIVACGLLPAFVFGLVPLARWVDGRTAAERARIRGSEIAAWSSAVEMSSGRRRRRTFALAAGCGVLLAINVALSPVDPLLYGAPYGSAYSFSYTPAPGYQAVEKLAALVPAGAYVLATDDLFPFVANDVNAYSFLYAPNQHPLLPFNATNEPTYVLISWSRTYLLPTWIETALYDPAVYGLRGIVWSTPEGAVVLFELRYTGPAAAFDSAPEILGTYFGGSAPLSGIFSGAIYPGGAGYLAALPSDPGGEAVVSTPGEEGLVWSGPGVNLPPGNYSIRLAVSVWAWNAAAPPTTGTEILTVDSNVWPLADWYDQSFTYGELRDGSSLVGSGPWTTIEFNVTVPTPSLGFEVRGYSLGLAAVVAIGSLTIAPA